MPNDISGGGVPNDGAGAGGDTGGGSDPRARERRMRLYVVTLRMRSTEAEAVGDYLRALTVAARDPDGAAEAGRRLAEKGQESVSYAGLAPHEVLGVRCVRESRA